MKLSIEYLPNNRIDDEGLNILRQISDSIQSAETEFVCRISDAAFAIAATKNNYDQLRPVLGKLDTNGVLRFFTLGNRRYPYVRRTDIMDGTRLLDKQYESYGMV